MRASTSPDQRQRNAAIRSYLDGRCSLLDAADSAGLGADELLDLVERVQGAERARSDEPVVVAGSTPDAVPDVSVIVPVFDEEGNIGPLLDRLVPALAPVGTYEIVFVDDHSGDRSRDLVLRARAANSCVKLVELSRNFGHQGALAAGLDHATGRAVVLMDADLQDPPEVVPLLVERWREGFDVVYAVREKRKEGPLLRAAFFVFYRVLRRVSDVDLPVDSGDFCLMDRRVVDAVRALPEANRFLRGLRAWVGFRQVGLVYERAARLTGDTKYTLRSRLRFALDGLLGFSDLPLRVPGMVGTVALLAATAYLLAGGIGGALGSAPSGWNWTMAVLLALGGALLLSVGLLGQYVQRIHQEVKGRPAYVVGRAHGTSRLAPPRPGTGRPGRARDA